MARFNRSPIVDVEIFTPVFYGTDGNDILTGSMFGDTFVGSRGNDTIDGFGSSDTISYDGSPFVEYVYIQANPMPVNLEIASSRGEPDLPGSTTIGNEIIIDFSSVGVEVDLAAGTAAKKQFYVEISGGAATIIGTTTVDTLISIENVIGSGGDDRLLGSAAANQLVGLAGDDTLDGRDGNDTLLAGAGRDTLVGGTGADVLNGGDNDDLLIGGAGADSIDGGNADFTNVVSYEASIAGVSVDLLRSGPQSGGDAEGDVLQNIQSVLGSNFNDTITGIHGFATGNDGNDTLIGGAQDNALVGGQGVDLIEGGSGDDVLYANTSIWTGLIVFGGPGDTLFGGDGNDTLVGYASFDTMYGGEGDDTYMAASEDLIFDTGGVDTVLTDGSIFVLGEDFENLTLVGNFSGHQVGFGNELDNILNGSTRGDTIHAMAGTDTVDGGGGNDLIQDLWGSDTVRIGSGTDTISGFDATGGEDHDILDMSSWGFGSLNDFYDQGGVIEQIGSDVYISSPFNQDGPIAILQQVTLSDIDETDFYFG